MAISFFKAENGGYYAAIETTTRDEETYRWVFDRRIELGRKSSFVVQEESPIFESFADAEKWLKENWDGKANWDLDGPDVDGIYEPTQENYKRCAQIAAESNEIFASGQLRQILVRENDHSYCCSIGVWYWSLGHRSLAALAYERSIKIRPEAVTFFNLAVCRDDMGQADRARAAIDEFYKLVASDAEKDQVEEQLINRGKKHLVRQR